MLLVSPIRRLTIWLSAGVTSVALLTGCASGTGDSSGATQSSAPSAAVSVKTVTAEPTPVESTSTPADASSDDAGNDTTSGGGDSWTMPNEVGMDLQDAQNDIQRLTDYAIAITKSHDASGQDRYQILDHDWKVCSQNIRAGSKIVESTNIVFNVVKQDETCP